MITRIELHQAAAPSFRQSVLAWTWRRLRSSAYASE